MDSCHHPDFTRGTVADARDWPIVARDGYAVGETAECSPWVDWHDCDFDRTGAGAAGVDAQVLSNLVAQSPFAVRATGGSLKTGVCRDYYGGLQTGSQVRLRGVEIELQLANFAGNQLSSDVTLDLEGCTVRSWSNNNTLIGCSDATYNAGVSAAPLILRGGNVIDEQLIGQKSGTWPTTADRSVAEVWGVKDPLLRDVINARLANYSAGANLIANGTFATDLTGWSTPDGGWVWSPDDGGVADHGPGDNNLRRLISGPIAGLVAGDIAEITFTLRAPFSGAFQCRMLNAANADAANRPVVQRDTRAAGVCRRQIVWQADYDRICFQRVNAGSTRFRLDDVSVRKLAPL